MAYFILVEEYINKKNDANALLVALQSALERNDCTRKENNIKLNKLKDAKKRIDDEIILNSDLPRTLRIHYPCGYLKYSIVQCQLRKCEIEEILISFEHIMLTNIINILKENMSFDEVIAPLVTIWNKYNSLRVAWLFIMMDHNDVLKKNEFALGKKKRELELNTSEHQQSEALPPQKKTRCLK
jgi:hypothetical protein